MVIRPDDALRLAPQIKVVEVEANRVLVVGATTQCLAIDGIVERSLIRMLTTDRVMRDLVAALESTIEAPRIHHAIRRLARFGVIVRAAETTNSNAARTVRVEHEPDIRVSLLAPFSLEALLHEGRAAQEDEKRWVFATPWADAVWIGPLLRTSGAPCVECLAARLAHNLPVLEFVERSQRPVLFEGAPDTSRVADAAALVTERITAWNEGRDDPDVLVAVDEHRHTTTHPLSRSAWCPACRSMEDEPTDERTLYDRLHALVDPILGLVARIEAPIGASAPYTCFAATPRRLPRGEAPDSSGFVRISSGKGATSEDARIGALAEAIERYAATYQGDEQVVRGSYDALRDDAIHPEQLLGFSERQYAERAAWAARLDDPRRHVPPRLSADAPILWTRARSLVDDRSVLVPTAMVYLGHRDACTFCYDDPNGHAAGVDEAQAILHALFELIERDAVAIWWYNRIKRPRLALDDLDDPEVFEWLSRFRRDGWSVTVLDLTTDFRIPVYAAIARDDAEPALGFGCHVDGRIALRRCLSELAQVRCARGAREARWAGGATDHFEPDGTSLVADVPNDVTVESVVQRVAQQGYDVLTVDLSRPQTHLKTVRVIAPGLRHFWPRLGPGRLYEVPVALGWRDTPNTEATLNDAPLLW